MKRPTGKRGAYKDPKKERFIEAFKKTGTIVHAAKAVGVGRTTVYEWRTTDPEFEAKFQRADEQTTWELEDSAMDRALRGSETLTIFLLKSRNPKKYAERFRHEIESGQMAELISEVASLVRRRIPAACAHCKTRLDLAPAIGRDLIALSERITSGKAAA
jgi:hypothetical protein